MIAEFYFDNENDFDMIEEGKNDVFVKLERICRLTPFVGMKQPAPSGSMLGYETVLLIKHFGEPARKYSWEILNNDAIIVCGVTDDNGISSNISLPMAYGKTKKYTIKVMAPIDENKPHHFTPEF